MDDLIKEAKKQQLCKIGDKVVIINGINELNHDERSVMRIVTVDI